MKRSTSALLLILALSAFAPPILARSDAGSAVHFGVMGGAALPISDLSDIEKTGWNAGALLTLGAPRSALTYRFEAQWQRFGGKDYISLGPADEFVEHRYDVPTIDGTANAVYTFAAARQTSFYLIGGAGVYNEHATDAFNGGARSPRRGSASTPASA